MQGMVDYKRRVALGDFLAGCGFWGFVGWVLVFLRVWSGEGLCFLGCGLWVLAFPCDHGGLLALPLCGAALTFFAAAKKVSKESGLTPPAPKRVPWLGGGRGASGISA